MATRWERIFKMIVTIVAFGSFCSALLTSNPAHAIIFLGCLNIISTDMLLKQKKLAQ